MNKSLVRRVERGMTTAEYAVGTLAAVMLAGVLLKVVTDNRMFEIFVKLIEWIFSLVFKWV